MTTAGRAAAVRAAFRQQAGYCAQLGSPFTALLCDVLAAQLKSDSKAGAAILGWEGDPSTFADNLPLRVTGALHALVRAGRAADLAAVYPPGTLPSAAELGVLLEASLRRYSGEIIDFLRFTPQTNEAGRSAVLMPGLLEIARRTDGLPLSLFEVGASAGLNLVADCFRYRFGGAQWGAADAGLTLAPRWSGPAPPVGAKLRVFSRRGCDLNPVQLSERRQRERLVAYIWPDQPDRLARLTAAMETALRVPPAIDQADAAEWLERVLELPAPAGVVQVVFHSIMWGYLDEAARLCITTLLEATGARSRPDSPLAWLRFELVDPGPAELRLRLWPGGGERLLAHAHPHGGWVRWFGD